MHNEHSKPHIRRSLFCYRYGCRLGRYIYSCKSINANIIDLAWITNGRNKGIYMLATYGGSVGYQADANFSVGGEVGWKTNWKDVAPDDLGGNVYGLKASGGVLGHGELSLSSTGLLRNGGKLVFAGGSVGVGVGVGGSFTVQNTTDVFRIIKF